ncbi:cell wall / vacuolar inhibitor of fructosidase 2-like [Solanum stenotomum]|uniref:cell wall / vacuolar inhibitor of fructosidase 2-like n=1 Tax=Solanum stenotomum TaxID=172797 RepID=UPI0020D01F47|nr:cell wall / vacuolar inhibitor of fructosidase 2-like [Solanum stenotomum]XP_049388692.1 cell wall / vacuolar inhibitor of fructosidase 2-like [Solanum stenotomum]
MPSNFHFLLILVFLFSLQLPTISTSSSSIDLIQQTCKNTKYYDLCVSSLKSDSTSLKADTKGLATIMVKIGMVNATATNTFLSSHELVLNTTNYTNNDLVLMKKLLKDCADKYALATNALQDSLQDLNNEVYDYAYLHVMAAADYPNVCHNGFKRNPRLDYPTQLAIREDGFKHICDVVLGILDALGW